jgi:signal transduction histidine kinase
MAKPGKSSFRRILLSRILLLSVPVLLIGETVAFRKARSSLLETARQNLKESAIRKAESIEDAVTALRSNLLTASQTVVLQEGTAKEAQTFLTQLAGQLPTNIKCLQLTNLKSGDIIASTCGNQVINPTLKKDWFPSTVQSRFNGNSTIRIEAILPTAPTTVTNENKTGFPNQLNLLFTVPIYGRSGNLRYALSLQSALHEVKQYPPGSLTGSMVVIAEDGTILAHPLTDRVGKNISQEADVERLRSIVKNATTGREDFLHLSFHKKGEKAEELLAGYTAIYNPITSQPNQQLIVLAVTPLNNALFGLEEIKFILIVLTVGLIGGSLLATLYMARDLARPLEKLRDYAQNIQDRHTVDPVPHDFKIRELHQLAAALDSMVERLKTWADELETAWKEAKDANKLKSEFLATTSHELRNPLNAIINCVRLVRDGYCDHRDEELDFLQRAEEAAIHLLGIINDVLDISKIEEGKLSVVLEPVDLEILLQEVVNLQSVNIQHKGLKFSFIPPQQKIPVLADPAKLKQVLINVIGNAIKFTEQGSVTITTEIQETLDNATGSSKPQVMVIVTDTGVGVDPAQQHKLFRPFVMVDGSTTRRFGGTGLGLAISKNLMQLMGGTITLYSAGANQGTTVTIFMPIIDALPLRSPGKGGEDRELEVRS